MKCLFRFFLMLLFGILSGCAAHTGASSGSFTPSDFLPPEAKKNLRDGNTANWESYKVYKDESVDWSQYDKIMVDPILVYVSTDPSLQSTISQENEQYVINYFHSSLVDYIQKSPHYSLAAGPGPGTIRVMIAITQLDASNVTLDAISTYIPQARLLSTVGTVHREKPAFVGEIGIEVKAKDANTGQLLAAGIDHRYGGKKWGKNIDQWADVKNIIDYYNKVIMYRLCKQKKNPDCPTP